MNNPIGTGKFITVEGSEGVGKTTNITFIKEWFENQGIDYICTREPGGTPMAEQIRELLLQPRKEKVNQEAELLLVFAARAQHLDRVVKPALAAGKWVLCDRFTDATYAYQGGGREMNSSTIASLENLVQGQLRPDAVLLLDIDVTLGLGRARTRGELDRFEQEDIQFFERVRAAYLERARDNTSYHVIDASQGLDEVQQRVAQVLEKLQQRLA